MPSAAATVGSTSSADSSPSSGTKATPSANLPPSLAAASTARLVFPIPPGGDGHEPRARVEELLDFHELVAPPHEARRAGGQAVRSAGVPGRCLGEMKPFGNQQREILGYELSELLSRCERLVGHPALLLELREELGEARLALWRRLLDVHQLAACHV